MGWIRKTAIVILIYIKGIRASYDSNKYINHIMYFYYLSDELILDASTSKILVAKRPPIDIRHKVKIWKKYNKKKALLPSL